MSSPRPRSGPEPDRAALSALADQWLDRFRSELDAAAGRLERGETDLVFRTMHDAKALGPTFGFTLVGQVASRTAERLRRSPLGPADHGFVAAAHAALVFIAARRLTGDGGDAGRAILAKLDALSSSTEVTR